MAQAMDITPGAAGRP